MFVEYAADLYRSCLLTAAYFTSLAPAIFYRKGVFHLNAKNKDALYGYLYILPSFLLLLIFSIIPIFLSVYFSFTEYNVIQSPTWVGLNNYIRMLKDPFVTAALKNTVIYTLISVPLQTILSLVIAALIAGEFRNTYGNFLKSAMFVPVISSAILVGTLWGLMLTTDGGLINNVLALFGIGQINWLGSIKTSLISVCITAVWKNIGYFLVIFYAGILDIPSSHYEASKVDGASGWQQFWYITIPQLKPITYLVITLGMIWSFQVFDLVYVMTGGGPGKSTTTLVLYIYTTAFREYSMGYASSIAFLMFIVIILLNSLQNLLFRERN